MATPMANKINYQNVFEGFVKKQNVEQDLKDKMFEICANDLNFCIHDSRLMCMPCEQYFDKIDSKHVKSNIGIHTKSSKHEKNVINKSNKRKSTEDLSTLVNKDVTKGINKFWLAIAAVFMAAGIPFERLNCKALRSFLFEWIKQNLPKPDTLRKNYAEIVYNMLFNNVKELIGNNKVYLQVDETSDALQRTVCNIMCGVLNGTKTKPYLIATLFPNGTSGDDIKDAMIKACDKMGINYDNVVLCLTDQAPACLSGVKKAKKTFKNMKHVTCIAHAMQRVCETIRQNNLKANTFVTKFKELMTNSPKRKREFKEICNIALPKQPVITRWGTWLEVCYYYAQHYDKICKFIVAISHKNKALEELKTLIGDEELKVQLENLLKYKFLTDTIVAVQTDSLTINEQLKMVQDLIIKFKAINDMDCLAKLKSSLEKNTDFILYLNQKYTPSEVYSPMSTVWVERSFSTLKFILTDKRVNLTPEHIEQYLFVKFNHVL